MVIPMVVLAILAIVFGWAQEDVLLGLGTARWSALLHSPLHAIYTDMFFSTELASFPWKLLLPFLTFIILRRSFRSAPFTALGRWSFLHYQQGVLPVWGWWVIVHRFGFISFYRLLATSSLVLAYRTFFRLFDRGVFELYGPLLAVRILRQIRRQHFVFLTVPLATLSGWLVLCIGMGWVLFSPVYAPMFLILLPFIVRLYFNSSPFTYLNETFEDSSSLRST